MTKIKLVNGIIINASRVELVKGVLKITTTDFTVEELAALFENKDNTNYISLLTESGEESGFKTGFTSFAGIIYDSNGAKTVELFQPKDVIEARLSVVEGNANSAIAVAENASIKASELEEQNLELASTVDSILTDIIPNLNSI